MCACVARLATSQVVEDELFCLPCSSEPPPQIITYLQQRWKINESTPNAAPLVFAMLLDFKELSVLNFEHVAREAIQRAMDSFVTMLDFSEFPLEPHARMHGLRGIFSGLLNFMFTSAEPRVCVYIVCECHFCTCCSVVHFCFLLAFSFMFTSPE